MVVFSVISQLFPTQNAAPSTRHGDCSTAHQRCLAELPQVFQHLRQVVHRDERLAVLGAQAPLVALQDSAPQRLGLGEGAAGLQHVREPQPWIATGAEKFPRLRGGERALFWLLVVSWIQISGSKYFLSSCYYRLYLLMLFDTIWCLIVVNTVAYCNLQLSLCSFVASLDANLWWQDNTVLDSTIHVYCLLMCSSLWRDWGPHRLSAKSAKRCSGPNLSAVASARHRSLGPWGCLSHGGAVANHVTKCCWSTWKTKEFQENGQVRKMAKVWDSFQLQSEAPWLLGCNPWPLLQTRDLQPDAFTHQGGGVVFF